MSNCFRRAGVFLSKATVHVPIRGLPMAKPKPQSEKELADILFPEGTDESLQETILDVPPDQRRLHTETYDFSVSTILDYLKEDKKMFIPEFQRRYVWSDTQASRLIESLIIQCPIPVVYLNQEKDERFSVIDGNQRLTSLSRYARNLFPLKGLTAYPELEGKYFDDLDPRFQRHILNRTLRCIVILKDTHPQVKFDVFERLNTGSVKLTAQELRHGLYYGALMKLVSKLAKHKEWSDKFPPGKDRRMRSEEFVLRFLAFHYESDQYEKPLAQFLNKFAERRRNAAPEVLAEMETLFDSVVSALSNVYGDMAFKVFDEDRNIQSSFNAALFDAQILAVSKNLARAVTFSAPRRKAWLDKLAAIFLEVDFQKSIGRATSDEKMIEFRISRIGAEFAKA